MSQYQGVVSWFGDSKGLGPCRATAVQTSSVTTAQSKVTDTKPLIKENQFPSTLFRARKAYS